MAWVACFGLCNFDISAWLLVHSDLWQDVRIIYIAIVLASILTMRKQSFVFITWHKVLKVLLLAGRNTMMDPNTGTVLPPNVLIHTADGPRVSHSCLYRVSLLGCSLSQCILLLCLFHRLFIQSVNLWTWISILDKHALSFFH